MKNCLKNEGFHQYCLIQVREQDLDGYMITMLAQYRGDTLLPMKLQCRDEERCLAYEISGMESVEQMVSIGDMKGRSIWKLFEAVWKFCDEVEEYLLPMEGIRLKPEQIYYDSVRQQFFFCYSLEQTEDFMEKVRTLAEFCMKHTDHEDSEAVFFIYGLYRILQEDSVDRSRLRHYMEESGLRTVAKTVQRDSAMQSEEGWESACEERKEETGSGENRRKKQESIGTEQIHTQGYSRISRVYAGGAVLAVGAALVEGIRYLCFTYRELELKMCIILVIVGILLIYSFVRSHKSEMWWGDKRKKEEEGEVRRKEASEKKDEPELTAEDSIEISAEINAETTVLSVVSSSAGLCWQLKGQKETVPDISLSHLPGVIGRRAEDVDYPVMDAGVSRRHLMLFRNEDRIYAEDLGSTNGTYVNEIRIKPGEPFLLQEGDLLKIGSNQYQFRKGL